jgi:carbamoyl-phosphate synthase large subunit
VLKTNFIETATKIMLNFPYEKPNNSIFDLDYIGIKAPQFSFSRLSKADPVLGVDMASTGEVGCIGEDFYDALLKSMLSVGYTIPKKNILLSTGPVESKADLLESAKLLKANGFELFATAGTEKFLSENGIDSTLLYWPDESKSPNTLEYLKDKKLDMVINIPKNLSKNELDNDYLIRRRAVDFNIPLITNARLAKAFIAAICKRDIKDLTIKSWDEY